MNHQLIEEFKILVNEGDLRGASVLIPKILTLKQYRNFCEKTRKYLCRENRREEAIPFELAEVQAMLTEESEHNKDEAESIARQMLENANLLRTVYEDSETSFEMLSEKAAYIIDKEILFNALIELSNNEN
jgi:hypothetical protein